MMMRAIVISLVMMTTFIGYGQSKSKLQGKGETYFEKEQFEEMLEFIDQQGDAIKGDPFYDYYMGMSLFYTLDRKEESIPFLESYLENNDKSEIAFRGHQHIYRMLGKMYHLKYRFDEAKELYRTFMDETWAITELPEDVRREITAEAERAMAECEFGKIQVKNPRNVLIESLGDSINTKYPEYAAVVSQDESRLIFTSRRPDTRGGKLAKEGGGYYEDIYTADLVKGSLNEKENLLADPSRGWSFHLATDFEYRNFRQMNKEINSKDHDGSIQLDQNDEILYFYRDGDIWSVYVANDSVNDPQQMGVHVNSNHYEPSIFFSYDGTKLFVVSDRPGGYGGLDIYISYRIGDNEWTTPKNCGPNVNTPYDEDAPYLDPNESTLYFSSKGHSSMGDYDIFRSNLENDTTWSVPVNLGFPINTPADDIYFTMTKRYNRGYYASSDLIGAGGMDLYRITFTDERDPVAELFGKVMNENGVSVEAQITLTSNDGETITRRTNGEDGGYFLLLGHGKTYHLDIAADGFTPYGLDFEVPELKEYVQFYQEVHLKHIRGKEDEIIGQEVTLYNAFGETFSKEYSPYDERQIKRIQKARNIKGNIKVLKQIQFYFDRPPLEKMVEEESIFDLSIEDKIFVLKQMGYDITDPDSYELYLGPRNLDEWFELYGDKTADVQPDPDTPEGTTDAHTIKGLFFTVQIGVYSRDVDRSVLFNLDPIVTLKTPSGLFRYSTGTFKDLESAVARKEQIVKIGITDAFATAYYNGERITIEKALSLIEENGPGILKD